MLPHEDARAGTACAVSAHRMSDTPQPSPGLRLSSRGRRLRPPRTPTRVRPPPRPALPTAPVPHPAGQGPERDPTPTPHAAPDRGHALRRPTAGPSSGRPAARRRTRPRPRGESPVARRCVPGAGGAGPRTSWTTRAGRAVHGVTGPYDRDVRCARPEVPPGGFHKFTHFHARAHATGVGRTTSARQAPAACDPAVCRPSFDDRSAPAACDGGDEQQPATPNARLDPRGARRAGREGVGGRRTGECRQTGAWRPSRIRDTGPGAVADGATVLR